jgi:type IV pilus assembly protein PilP
MVLTGCKDDGPSGPTAEEYDREREAVVARVKSGSRATQPAATTPVAAAVPAPVVEPEYGAVRGTPTYDPIGKRDPFRSFEWEQKASLLEDELRGPLEQFDVGQLSIVGMVWKTKEGNARALVQGPSGKNYIVGEGTRIGKNEGTVIRIDDNLVVVKERYVDFLGEETTKDIEMRIRRSEGG